MSADYAPVENRNEAVEPCSVEAYRSGPLVWVGIRSEARRGVEVGLSREDALDLADRITRAANSDRRPIRDWPQA